MIHYPKYAGSYLKRTLGLTMQQDGAYSRAIDLYYIQEGPLPPKPEIYDALRCRLRGDRAAVDLVLERYFLQGCDNGWIHIRCEEEIERFRSKSRSASANSLIGWEMRHANANAVAKRSHSGRKAGALPSQSERYASQRHRSNANRITPVEIPSESLVGQSPDPPTEKPVNGKRSRRELIVIAVGLLAFLNDKTGAKYEPVKANVDLVVARLNEGFTEKAIRQVIANRCLAWQGDPKMDEYLRPKTLFGARNFASYAGQIGKTPVEPIPQEKT